MIIQNKSSVTCTIIKIQTKKKHSIKLISKIKVNNKVKDEPNHNHSLVLIEDILKFVGRTLVCQVVRHLVR